MFAFSISSTSQLTRTYLYIRGGKVESDDREFYCRFDSESDAERCLAYIREGVAAINATGEGKEKTPPAIIELEHVE